MAINRDFRYGELVKRLAVKRCDEILEHDLVSRAPRQRRACKIKLTIRVYAKGVREPNRHYLQGGGYWPNLDGSICQGTRWGEVFRCSSKHVDLVNNKHTVEMESDLRKNGETVVGQSYSEEVGVVCIADDPVV